MTLYEKADILGRHEVNSQLKLDSYWSKRSKGTLSECIWMGWLSGLGTTPVSTNEEAGSICLNL